MAKFLQLEDVEETAKIHPDTFIIPPIDERKFQRVGNSVRLHFKIKNPADGEPQAERMWVTITQTAGFFRSYKGILENAPVYIEDLKQGDEVTFKSCHIAQTIIKRGDPRWIDCANLKAFVSEMCFEPSECVRFLYREAADQKEDSGWRMFTGHESDEYSNDPKNIRLAEVGYMLDRDPSLLQPLKANIGSAFERKNKEEPWNQITDWSQQE